jgi:NAD(P)-dependent dehydrogenase (short-subunit alcohol dehydrogenase family)
VPDLKGRVAVVAGATRGAGRGISCELGRAGATVYCTGRSVRGSPVRPGRPETVEETAEMVAALGGVAHWARVDHTVPEQVRALFERVEREQGRLDILVNDLTGDGNVEQKPFLEHSLEKGLSVLENGSHSHIITSHYGAPLMIRSGGGLIVEMTDGIDDELRDWNFYYDLEKATNIRLARSLAHHLRGHKVAAVALSPGFMRSEEVLDHFGVAEANWRDAVAKDRFFQYSETPFYVGRAVAALAADPDVMKKSGQALLSGKLAREYGFTDVDGSQPIWAY